MTDWESAETKFLDGSFGFRPGHDGSFDEFFMYHNGECIVHAEMMNDRTLWIGFYPPERTDNKRAVMWINVEKGRLAVDAHED